MMHGDRMVRDDLVQVPAMERHVELGVVEHEGLDPEPGRSVRGLLEQRLLQLLDGADVGVHLVQLVDTARMTVGVDEARRDGHLRGVDHLGAPCREVGDVAALADGHESAVLDRERLGPGARVVNRVDARVHDHEIRLHRPLHGACLLTGRHSRTATDGGAGEHTTQPEEFGA